ncbi:MAG: chorismate lyase [Pseudomonadota bacterium]|nr:chorismate lyase [Pseudomonadota bacterium]
MSVCRANLIWRQRKQCLHERAPASTARWLFDRASLTARIMAACKGQFRVRVLSVKRGLPRLDEALALRMRERNQALVRQVLLYCNDQPWVYARTVIPLTSLRGPLRGLTRLGNKPLGAVLFANRTMRRSVIEVTKLVSQHPCYPAMQNHGNETIWGRRSVFHLHSQPLLVSEFFLPGIK